MSGTNPRVTDMHITKIETMNLPPFFDPVGIDCDEQVNLFIGPNASGKSTILRGIVGLHSLAVSEPPNSFYQTRGIYATPDGNLSYTDEENYPTPEGGLDFSMWSSDDWPRDDSGASRWNEVPFLYIPATRTSLPERHVFEPYSFDHKLEDLKDVEPNAILKRLFATELGIFDGRYVELAIDQLRKEMIGNLYQQNELRNALMYAYSCVQSICSEVIRGGSPHPYVDRYESYNTRRTVHHGMGVETIDSIEEGPLYAGALSSGTQGTLLWVYALVLKIWDHYGSEIQWGPIWGNAIDKPAILLIDEIENHLHPTWQRRVIPALLEHFPGLQIFATTHSPFVVAGLKAGQVHLLNRENGVAYATTNTEDIVGWTADEILRNMMGVDEPTDQLTVDRANRLRQLREKETLTSEEESDLKELRRQVNEDLLSKGGPLEAQRGRYADLMEQFLLSRQSELSQDGDQAG